jgi:SAM-dependent methyltransferase
MSDPEYEYHGMLAQTWDLFRGDTSNWDDRFFYPEIIHESGQPVLDVGCGTGRLLLDYLAQGVDIDGVDNSPEMLSLCRQKAEVVGLKPALFESSMETMNLPRHYQTIIVPSSSFQLVMDPLQAQAAMLHFFAHLLPGGTLVMPFMLLWKKGDPLSSWRLTGEKTRPEDGATIKRWSRSRYDPESLTSITHDLLLPGNIPNNRHRICMKNRALWILGSIRGSLACLHLQKTKYSRSQVRDLDDIIACIYGAPIRYTGRHLGYDQYGGWNSLDDYECYNNPESLNNQGVRYK